MRGVAKKGNINLGNIIIEHVSLFKGLKRNLISINQLCGKGFSISFEEDKCIGVSKDKSQSFTGKRFGNYLST